MGWRERRCSARMGAVCGPGLPIPLGRIGEETLRPVYTRPRRKASPESFHYRAITFDLWTNPQLTVAERAVYITLCFYATPQRDTDGFPAWRCFPSNATIADASGLGERSVSRAIARLEHFGWLSVEQELGGLRWITLPRANEHIVWRAKPRRLRLVRQGG